MALIVDILLNDILISILGGVYSGLIASKYMRYLHIRLQAAQIAQRVLHLHGPHEARIQSLQQRELAHLSDLGSELGYLGYRTAAQHVTALVAELQALPVMPASPVTPTQASAPVSAAAASVAAHLSAQPAPAAIAHDDPLETRIRTLRHLRPALLPTLRAWRV